MSHKRAFSNSFPTKQLFSIQSIDWPHSELFHNYDLLVHFSFNDGEDVKSHCFKKLDLLLACMLFLCLDALHSLLVERLLSSPRLCSTTLHRFMSLLQLLVHGFEDFDIQGCKKAFKKCYCALDSFFIFTGCLR